MIGIGLHIGNRVMGGGIDAQAQAHYDRVIADGGVVPSGLSGVNAFYNAVKTIYGTTDITTAVSVGLDAQYLGYKLGAGAGATSGQAAQKLYSCAGSSGDVVQTTAASQPLLLAHSGVSTDNYWFGSRVDGNTINTPSSSASNISGDFELIMNLSFDSVTNDTIIAGKADTSGQYSYYVYYVGNQTINFVFSTNGTSFTTVSSSAFGFVNNTLTWIKITRSGSTFTFSKSLDGINYTQINQVSSVSSSFFAGTNSLTIGGGFSNTYTFGGKIYRVTLAKSINGTPVVDFNPSTYNASTSQTQWTSTTGEVWTINTGTATTGYKGALVDRTIVQADGVDDNMTGTMSAALISTFNNNNNGVNLVAKRYIISNNQFIATFGGDYTSNNSAQIWLSGGGTFLNTTRSGSAFESGVTTGTYTIPNYIIYSENIIYGGTSSLRLNSTTNTTGAINGTTNKPVIVSGNIALFNSGFGKLNGLLNTLIVTSDGAKFVEIGNFMKQINNM